MKSLLFIALIATALSQNLIADLQAQTDNCFLQSKSFYEGASSALKQTNIESIIDSLEKLVERVPSLMRACGAEEEATAFETAYPPACTRLLSKEAKIMVKIMRLYAEDQEKNEKQIMVRR
jgi:hypothetical protein